MKMIAFITESAVVDSILLNLKRHGATPARDPPSKASPHFSPGIYYGRRIAVSRRACLK
jgi:hypothetical protein